MRIVFAGTPDFAVAPLKKLISMGEVVAVITQTDKPVGRKAILTPSPVKVEALKNNIPVLQPEKIREEVESLKELKGDILITCAYGQILSQEVLNVFPLGVWNLHASLLPKYRGASPIQWAVINGDKETGVTVMKTELSMDSGGILLVKKLKIEEQENSGELSARLSDLAAKAIEEALPFLEKGKPQLLLQDECKVSIVKKIKKEQAKIDFNQTAEKIVNLIRGMNPAPIAFCNWQGTVFNVFSAEKEQYEGKEENGIILCASAKKGLIVRCKNGAVKLLEIQASGGKRMKANDYLNGRKISEGTKFNDESLS